MMVYTVGGNNNKLNSKGELIDLLGKYKNVLNNEIIDYLNSLIELEFSAIRDYISEDDKKILSELEIYKKILIYNIYYRAVNLLIEDDNTSIINAYNGLRISKNDYSKDIKLFDFDYCNDISEIILHKSVYDESVRKEEMDHILKTLEYLYDEKNPYSSYDDIYGGPDSQWELRHIEKIEEYEKKFKLLDNKILSNEEQREIAITKKYNDILLEDYGLKEDDFKETKNPYIYDSSKMNKILIKGLPGINVKNKIRYI